MSKTTRRDVLKSGAMAGLAGLVGCNSEKPTTPAVKSTAAHKVQSQWAAPPKQTGNNLNVIVLVSDSFRADNLEAYGSQWVETPNLNQFAKESIVFDSFYPEGMPTIPIRRQLYTGRRIFPTHLYFQQDSVKLPGWHELFLEDVTLSETLQAANYQTALIADLPHLFKPSRNFHRGFNYWEWVRGQEVDFYAQAPRKVPDFTNLYPAEYLDLFQNTASGSHAAFPDLKGDAITAFLNQYTANRKRWTKRASSIVETTATSTIDWLKQYHDQGPFYLQVEVFDPHEPWDPPAYFLAKYLKDPTKHSWPEPPYLNVKVPEEGVKRLRANYAGEASNVDYWYGKVIQTIKDLGLYDNTIVVFLSDHGALLNEQGQWVKGPDRIRGQVTHVPLIVHLPKSQFAGKRVSGFVQPADVLPTVLGRLNLKSPARVTGEDLWPYINGGATNNREYVVSSFGYIAAVRTPEWNYSAVWNKEKFQGSYKPQLYDLKNDPNELKSVADQHPQVVKDLQAKLDEYINSGKDITNGTFSEEIF
jgi:arylsulfatase A-like enzyme